jgi:hypothetical protein
MVERTDSQGFDEFDGEIAKVEVVPSKLPGQEDKKQYKLHMKTIPATLTKTGMMYTWIGIPNTATEKSVPNGSVIEAYIRSLERLDSSLKKMDKVEDVFMWLQGKKFHFNREQLGKAYKNNEAADYWVPVRQI